MDPASARDGPRSCASGVGAQGPAGATCCSSHCVHGSHHGAKTGGTPGPRSEATGAPGPGRRSAPRLPVGTAASAGGPWAGAPLTVLVGADDHGRALGPWSHLGVSHCRDAVLRPLVQRLQQDLGGGRGDAVHLLGLRVLRAQRSVADAIAHQGPVVRVRRRRAPTYQNGCGARADALHILRGGGRFYWRGRT